MRIVAGRHRGVALVAPAPGKGDIRPTSDRVRESLFNVLAHGPYGDPVAGARVLDLFAGTGALGLEALSRGAANVTLVDQGRAALDLLRRNVARIGGEQAQVIARDATRLGPNPGAPYDLVFLDPPYGRDLGPSALASAREGGWLAPGALIVIEEHAGAAPPPGLTPLDTRRYGDTMISILRAS